MWGGFVRGLFEGETFNNTEVRQGFEEIFSKNFLDKLSRAESQEEFNGVLQRAVSVIDPEAKGTLFEWFKHHFQK